MEAFSPQTHRDRLVAQNQLAFAFLSYIPIVPGHVLISPLRVVKTASQLTQEEWAAIFELKSAVCKALGHVFGAEGFNYAWNEGEMAGQTVPHFHLHIVPRKQGDMGIWQYDPRQFLYRPGSRARSPEEELKEIASYIRSVIPSNDLA